MKLERPTLSRGLRATAVVVSVGLLALFALTFVGEGPPDWAAVTDAEIAGFVATAGMLTGLIVSWFSPLVGSVFVLGGWVAFSVIDGDLNLTNPFVLFPLVVVLHAGAALTAPPASAVDW